MIKVANSKPLLNGLIRSTSPFKIISHYGRRNIGTATFLPITDLFITMHETSGIPWIALIPLTTFTLRTFITLPLSIWQRKRIVKQQELRKIVQATTPVVKVRLAAMTVKKGANGANNSQLANMPKVGAQKPDILTPDQIRLVAVKETRKRQKKLFKRYNVPLWKNVMLPLIQIPLWITVSMGVRSLVDRRLLEAGETWARHFDMNGIDLSGPLEPIPMLIPMLLGVFSMLNVEFNGRMMLSKDTDLVGIKTFRDEFSSLAQGTRSIMNISRMGCIFMMGVSSQTSISVSYTHLDVYKRQQ